MTFELVVVVFPNVFLSTGTEARKVEASQLNFITVHCSYNTLKMTKTSVKAQNEMTNLGLSEINASFLMELNLLFEWTIKFFLTLHRTQSSSKRAVWDHPDPATEGPLLYKLLKADFVVRGGKDCLSFSWCLRHCFR